MDAIRWWMNRFQWENDNWWWELVRLDEIHPKLEKLNFVIPDKLSHFLTCFFLTWLLFKLGVHRHWAAMLAWFVMMGPWEFLWDGCFRYGASWKDMVANTLGTLICWWWLSSYDIVGQSQL